MRQRVIEEREGFDPPGEPVEARRRGRRRKGSATSIRIRAVIIWRLFFTRCCSSLQQRVLLPQRRLRCRRAALGGDRHQSIDRLAIVVGNDIRPDIERCRIARRANTPTCSSPASIASAMGRLSSETSGGRTVQGFPSSVCGGRSGEALEFEIHIDDVFLRLEFRHGDAEGHMVEELLEAIALERVREVRRL